MARIKIRTASKKRESIDSYYSDMNQFQLLGRAREITLFREIEEAEYALITHLIKDEEILDSVVSMFDRLSIEKGVEAGYKKIVKNFIDGDRTVVGMKKFVRVVRFTEAGRSWLDSKIGRIPDRNSKSWKRKAIKYKTEYLQLKNSFVAANLRLVVMLAKKHSRSWLNMTMNDLIQEGNLGLIKAVDKYDVDKGYRFATYATWWVRHFIKRSIIEKDPLIRIPVHIVETLGRINKIDNVNKVITGESFDEDYLVAASDMNKQKVVNAMKHRRGNKIVSMDAPVRNGEEMTLSDTLPDTNQINPEYNTFSVKMSSEVRSLLTSLTPIQSSIIKLRFGFDCNPHTLEEVGDKYDLTRERIRQIEAVALRRLRTLAGAQRYAGDLYFGRTG